jgi:hypothetical protein
MHSKWPERNKLHLENSMTNRSDGGRGGGETRGPFPASTLREQPWRATETDHGPFERRRGGDRRGLEEMSVAAGTEAEKGRRRRAGRRKADLSTTKAQATLTGRTRVLVKRFREPLIGLTLAGVAAPLINAGLATPRAAEPEGADATEPGTLPAAGVRDLEGEVGDYWAEAAEAVVRDQTIEGAAVRYGISAELAQKIYDAAAEHDIEPDVAYGLVFVESTFRERAVSHVGARGLAQVMPRTAQWLDPTVRTADLFDPEVNLDLGFRYLRQMIDKYDGNVHNALTAYNRGPGTVDRILRRGGNPDNGYAGKVLGG